MSRTERAVSIIILFLLLLPSVLTSAAPLTGTKTPAVEVNLPDPMDGVRHFPLNIKVNDPLLKTRANHFEVASGIDGFVIYSGWSGPNMSVKAVANQADRVMNNYNGESDLGLVISAPMPGQYDTKPTGYHTWIVVTFWDVVFVGNSKTLDSKILNAIPYENRIGVYKYSDKTTDWYTSTLLLRANQTINVVPANLSINLPTGYAHEYSTGYKPFTWIATATIFQGSYIQISDDVEGYTQGFTQDRLGADLIKYYNSTNPQVEFQKEAEPKIGKPLTFGKVPYTTLSSPKSLTNVNLFGDTSNLVAFSQIRSGVLQTSHEVSSDTYENIDAWRYDGFYYVASSNLKYGFSFFFQRSGYGARGTGAASVQSAESQGINLFNSITLTLDTSQVQPQVKKLETFYSVGEGINVAIIPVNWSDASCDEGLAYYQAVADKVKAYYSEVSYGALNLNVEVIQKDGAWINTGKSSADYHGDGDLNKFWTDSIKASENVIDYTKYDFDPANGKGIIVFVTPKRVFSCCYACSNSGPSGRFMTNKGVSVDAIYTDEHRYDLDAQAQCVRGVIHELCHVIGKLTVTSVQGKAKDLTDWLTPDEYLIGNVPDGLSLMGDNPESWTIERVNPDSYVKVWLGWLKYETIAGNATIVIPALDKMSAGDPVYTIDYNAPNTASNYYILEYRNAQGASTWDKEAVVNGTGASKAVVIYSVSLPSNSLRKTSVNQVWSMYLQGGSLNVTKSTFKDPINKLEVQPISLGDGSAQVKVSSFNPVNMVGAVADPLSTPAVPNVEGDRISFTLPDIDLHAYTSDGRHIGVNYATGVYENQVPGAISSGDLIGAREWIFVPRGVQVTFYTSSKDTASYFKELPVAKDLSSGVTTFSFEMISYDSNGKSTVSNSTTQIVGVGAAVEHSYTNSGGVINVVSKSSTKSELIAGSTPGSGGSPSGSGSTPFTGGVPGYPIESILLGFFLAVVVLLMRSRRVT